nr:solute carrier family 25 member 44-like isoform X1 [Nerophis lumbriciformis]
MQQKGAIQIIEWEDLDKRKFYSLGVLMTLSTRATVYPASLIRTRLQVQKGKALYSGTVDAFCKILRTEGVQGLYRGFMVNTFTLVSGQAYITTYELARRYVSRYSSSNTLKSVVAGGAASLVAQTITVPIDVVSQHLMMQGQGEHSGRFKAKPKMMLAATKRRLTFGQTRDISVQIFAADGFRGFYRGYVASLLTYIPNSALWWPFYHFYACVYICWYVFVFLEQLSLMAPSECPHLILQALAGPMAAATASTITNPMDVVRARVQVEGRSSVVETFKQLLAEEGVGAMTKGLSARIISSTPTSVLIVVGYETLKRLSLRDELVQSRHW